jgi:hypothetical protein
MSRGQRGGSPTVVNFSFIDRSRYFSFKQLLIYPHKGWADLVPDPLLLRKSGSAGNGTRDLCHCSQEFCSRDHRGGQLILHKMHVYGEKGAFNGNGNRTRDLCLCSQELCSRDHGGDQLTLHQMHVYGEKGAFNGNLENRKKQFLPNPSLRTSERSSPVFKDLR